MEDQSSAESGKVIVFQFGMTSIYVWPDARYLETRFTDGTFVRAAPEDNDAYRRTARSLGYGDDTWAMCLDHEMAHTLNALAHGRVVSPTLWAVAHGTEEMDKAMIANEEAEVLNLQRKFNLCRSR